ncbi:hypothetical protein ACFQ3R_11740 [Mesonia ostreae]|uniref:Uncharacterized protein n=1 Tax=Mesonia ostreae TaxID=861110 RepID=A0ABU2KID3_9FLAO|nr:hypothetical protein [Mesonia ostreae]MDT0294439.1 hypothetical protein [Mesonia ostreae]
MKKILLFIVVISLSFAAQAQQKTTPPIIVKKLEMGKSLQVHKDFSFDFIKVTEDSRCPTGVDCVWPGQAKVVVMWCKDGKEIGQKEVTFKANQLKKEPIEVAITNTKSVYIYQLNPYPTSSEKENLDYSLQITEHLSKEKREVKNIRTH